MSVDQGTASPTRLRARLLAVGAAVLTGVVVWVIAVPLLDVTLTATRGGNDSQVNEVGVVAIGVTGLVAGLAAWGLLALLEKFTAKARTVWTVIAGIVLLLSLAGPLSGGTSTGAKVALLAMHVAVGGVLILLLRRSPAAR